MTQAMKVNPVDALAEDNGLLGIVDDLFAGSRSTVPTATFGDVELHKAKVKQIASIIGMFNLLINKIPEQEFSLFVKEIGLAQSALVKSGKSPFDFNGEHGAAILMSVLEKRSLILTLFSVMTDALADFMAQFTTLKKEDFQELDLDEFAVICAGVVALNYGFFTRNLLPVVKGIYANWQSKKQKPHMNESAGSASLTMMPPPGAQASGL